MRILRSGLQNDEINGRGYIWSPMLLFRYDAKFFEAVGLLDFDRER